MKYCPTSANCPYGSVFEENTCAYYDDKTDYNCPIWTEEWENEIDDISKRSSNKNR